MAPHLYKKFQVRPRSLMRSEIRREAEAFITPQLTDNLVFYEAIFNYVPGSNTVIYYDFTDLAQDPLFYIHYFNRHPERFNKIIEAVQAMPESFNKISKGNPLDLVALRNNLKEHMALEGIIISMAENKFADTVLAQQGLRARQMTDKLDYIYFDLLVEEIKKRLPAEMLPWVDFLHFKEIETGKYPGQGELEARSRGYIHFKGITYTNKTLAEFMSENDMILGTDEPEDIEENLLKGLSVSSGQATGPARVVMEAHDFGKVEAGDIIIAPMTNPHYTSILNKVAGIVTDEGGITCHAAIISRELNKPCVVGTKVATKVIKDGDKVEVDADRGIVKIIK